MVPVLALSTRWYLRRAKHGYLRENAAYAQLTSSLAETVEGARSVEALQRYEDRVRRSDRDIRGSYDAERYTLFLRTVWFPVVEVGYLVPIVGTLLFGGWLTSTVT
jgi:ABC-type multidrug transport system fused ATPase/permease subunit